MAKTLGVSHLLLHRGHPSITGICPTDTVAACSAATPRLLLARPLADALGVYAAYDVSLYGDMRRHNVFYDASYGKSWGAKKHNGNAQ